MKKIYVIKQKYPNILGGIQEWLVLLKWDSKTRISSLCNELVACWASEHPDC